MYIFAYFGIYFSKLYIGVMEINVARIDIQMNYLYAMLFLYILILYSKNVFSINLQFLDNLIELMTIAFYNKELCKNLKNR